MTSCMEIIILGIAVAAESQCRVVHIEQSLITAPHCLPKLSFAVRLYYFMCSCSYVQLFCAGLVIWSNGHYYHGIGSHYKAVH